MILALPLIESFLYADARDDFNRLLSRAEQSAATMGAPARAPASTPNRTSCLTDALKVTLTSKDSPFPFKIGIGDVVSLAAKDNKTLNAIFLGRGTDNDFFYVKETNEIVAYHPGDLRYMNISEPIAESGAHAIQPILKIETQVGGTCAIHSTINCLKFLNEFGLVSNSQLKAHINTNSKTLFNVLNAVIGPREVAQTRKRIAIFNEYGIRAEQTQNIDALIKHLNSGRPAIMDLSIGEGTLQIKYFSEDKLRGNNAVVPASGSKILGDHSVLLIAYFKTGMFSGKFLVLDSNHGMLNLWDRSDVAKSLSRLKFINTNSATLVMPK
jgi:hypothetical protein